MLESVVADLLNRFLGDYVENLDRSQLKLGIWGGNVALENLQIRENALSELDVPFKVKAGQIDKLTLKIPWKNLYGEAVVASLEGLYLLVVPGASIKYDAEKEEKHLQEAKQRELLRIEEALQKNAEKGAKRKKRKHFKNRFKVRDTKKDKPKEEKKDTFLEKLATQVIKNLQVKITSIHVRYEDDITDATMPMSVGVTLGELSLQTSNESWIPCILNEAAKVIYKLVRLDCFSSYWNVNSEMYYLKSREQILMELKGGVMSGDRKPKDYQYIFKPVSASAKLYINPYAELELQTPKIDWTMEIQHVAIELTKPQYLSMIDLLESVDYMVRNAPYRKYRPEVSLQEDTRLWWNYATTCILEVHVRRRTRMWSWSTIRQHRLNLKTYKSVYKGKLTQSKVPEETQKNMQSLERILDVFSIVLARQQAQAEVIRSGQKLLAKKSPQAGEKRGGGWFGGFWGKKEAAKKEDSDELSVPEKIDDLMTPEERTKLFTAIGYSESSHYLTLPKNYVAHVLAFTLLSTSVTIREDVHTLETLSVQIIDLSTKVSQRPGAQALKIEAKLKHWYVKGLKQQNIVPSLVASIANSESSLLEIQFETNPENSTADQVLILQSQPVEIIYDAITINALVAFFQTHKGMDLEQLTSATLMKLEEIKERTATGLSHIIETRKVLDLRIHFQPSYLLLPKTGFYHEKTDLIVLDFGSFQLNSIDQGAHTSASVSSLEELMDKAYDKFDVKIKNVQLLFGRPGEDWKKARGQSSSSLHILQPMDIEVQLCKAMVEKDSRMARFKVSGELPLLHVKISDQKIQGVFELVDSIPFPEKASTPTTKEKKIPAIPILARRPEKLLKREIEKSLLLEDEESDSNEEYFDSRDDPLQVVKSQAIRKAASVRAEPGTPADAGGEELTDLHLKFEVKEVTLAFTRQQAQREETVLVFSIQQLGTEASVKTYDLTAVSYLKKVNLGYYDLQGPGPQPLHLISSSDEHGQDLLKVEYVKADKNGPHFQTTFENTEQTLKVAFSSVDLLLHSQALLSAISFLTEAVPSLPDKAGPARAQKQQDKETLVKKATKVSRDKDRFDFKLFAKLDAFSVNVWDDKQHIAEIKIQGLDSSVFLQPNQVQAFARLKDVVINDVNPQTIYKKAVSMKGEEVFNFNLILYPEATQGEAYKDVSKVDGKVSLRVGCIQIVYLHKFLMSLLDFLNNFQVAKEKVSVATAQAAQRAATSVKSLAERSFRLLMDIDLKAPVIYIPQSSVSHNVIVADLGLLQVHNEFSLVSTTDQQLPPVVDLMSIQLTKFKLSRTVLHSGPSQPDIEILCPINLNLSVHRNLAATWYHEIPVIEVKGHLDTMSVGLSQEDISVLLNVLVENLGEAEVKAMRPPAAVAELGDAGTSKGPLEVPKSMQKVLGEISETKKDASSSVPNLLLHFEIKEVVVRLMRQVGGGGPPLHVLHVSQLGAETRVGNHDMTASVYLRKIRMMCNEFTGPSGGSLRLINSSDDIGEHLLKMEYIKADRDGPDFQTIHHNTEQTLRVSLSTLDLVLHTQALLSLMDFLSSAVPSRDVGVADRARVSKSRAEEQRSTAPRAAPGSTSREDAFDLKLSAKLNAFNIIVCDEKCNIADIKIQGMDASAAVQARQTDVFARLRDIIVTDVDPKTIHQKAVFIVGEEVFSFHMSLYPDATEAAAYTDMSKVDGKMSLKVGCIHIVYLHKFLLSLLNFLNNFQAAKEALSTATAQAAEKAASSMKDFAQKSFRLSMDIDLKAPVIIIPQSSISTNAIIADLGLIRVQNRFSLVPGVSCPLPPVIDKMDIQLTQLQLSRSILQSGSAQPELNILQPVNLLVSVQRNLSAAWYSQIPAMEIVGDLKPMQIALSQDDLTVLMSVLLENLAESPSLPSAGLTSDAVERVKKETLRNESAQLKDREAAASGGSTGAEEPAVTLKFDFHFESLSIVLYRNDSSKVADSSWLRSNRLRLGEMRLRLLTSSGRMFANSSMDVSTHLQTCTLDDLREGVTKATSRMIDHKDGSSEHAMININYKQSTSERLVEAILDKLYVCASVEFLMTVADFFVQAMPQSPATSEEKPTQSQPRQTTPTKTKAEREPVAQQGFKVKAVIMNPEIVFVASLSKADAPALAVSFQCNYTLAKTGGTQAMKADLKELKVLACPFLRELRGSNVTTVLQPCSLLLESKSDCAGGQTGSLTLEEVVIKISPIILNTVLTIMAALKPKPKEDEGKEALSEHWNIWDVRSTDSCNNWFLGVDSANEASECFQSKELTEKSESFDIEVKTVQVTLECGLGHRTVPMLLVESTFAGTMKNWTSLMTVAADTTLEVHYYNENFAVWEPLIERVESGKRRWNLKLEMKNNPIQDRNLVPGDDFIMLPEPQTAINISSKDTMNITISKCTLSVFSNLAKGFSEGTASSFDYSLKDRAPLTVKNALGVPIVVQHGSNLRALGSKAYYHEVAQEQVLELEFSTIEPLYRGKLSALHRQESSLFTLCIVPQGYTEVADIPVTKPARRLYNVRSPQAENCVSILMQIDAAEGNKVITIRSPLQIKNHFSVPFTIYKFVANAKLLEPIGVAKQDEEFHVPLDSYRCQLFLKPAGVLEGQFKVSTSYITWKEMLHRSSEVRCTLQCPASEVSFLPLVVNCTAVPDQINFIASHGEKDWDPAYIIHLFPSLTIRNLLPYSIRYLLEGTAEAHELAEGSSSEVLNSRIGGEIMELVLIKYQGRNWNGHFRVHEGLPEFFPVCFTADSSDLMTVDLSLHVRRVGNRMVLSVFSPYWIINKTSRVLQYRAEDIHVKHPADYRDVILFAFKRKNIFSNNKIQLCISTSLWSPGFSMDTVGSYGCVKCPAGKMEYLVGVNITMSSFNLSRIVTLTPFYTLVNKCELELEVGEIAADGSMPTKKWHYISSSECVPFWPENMSGKLCVRVVGCEGLSKPFFFNKQDNGTLLSLESMNTGLMVDVSISDHSIVIKFSDYYEGAAPAQIINQTPRACLTYNQSGTQAEWELRPGEARYFAWADPTGNKTLMWRCSQTAGEHNLLKDECGQFAYNQNIQIHWVSFLDGRQRVLLFTEDVALVSKARQAEEMEQPDQEINVSIHSLGLSLINNETKQEISYIGITSSGVVWEMMPKLKWKPFNQKQIMQLEQAYKTYLNATSKELGWIEIDSKFKVSFSTVPMGMLLPVKCSIRRNFLSGIHVEFKQSPHQRSLRAQLYWLQVDNQLPGSMFPAVFHPVAPPKSIALDSEPKPFIDVSIITRFNEFSKVMQFKYFMVLIQSMALKVDQGFLAAIIGLFTPATDPEAERQRTHLIQKDLDALSTELMESSMTDITTLSFFEHFHISPVKLHLSLSLGAGAEEANAEDREIVAIHSVNLLLKSIGATLTDVDDLIFKLACFEVRYQFYKRDQLMWLVVRHYSEQFLKQMYVLLLGLDVLGNPFGLIRGLSEGVEAFFYEPFQGAVQGPEEFAEGFVIGVKSLLGHTVGGAAGVVSRITGSVGKGLAAITMDKEYQQKRREEMGRQPKDFGDSLAKGGKGFLRGVVGGVTGIITKPVEGAKKEGAAGFFKGIGKGLVGVVARPTGGIIDMASSTFQGIQRVAESTEEVSPLRPPRLIHEDGIIRPYNLSEAQGFSLFEISNIKKLDGEIYRYYCGLPEGRKSNLVVTNRRLMCVKEVEILGHISIDWDYSFEEFTRPPSVEENILHICVKDHGLFQKKDSPHQESHKRIALLDRGTAQRVLKAIDDAQTTRQQHTLVRQRSERFIKQYTS